MAHLKLTALWLKAFFAVSILGAVPAPAQHLSEAEAWAVAKVIGTRQAVQMFLEMFPDGTYAPIAFEILADQTIASAPPPNVEQGWNWDIGVEQMADESVLY